MISDSNYIYRFDTPVEMYYDAFDYKVFVNDVPVFTGRYINTGVFEINLEDFIEQFIAKNTSLGAHPDVYMRVKLRFEMEDWADEKTMELFPYRFSRINSRFFNYRGLVNTTLFSNETVDFGKAICVAVYPVFYYKVNTSALRPDLNGKVVKYDTSFLSEHFGEGYERWNCARYYSTAPQDEMQTFVNILTNYDSVAVYDAGLNNKWKPKMITEDNEIIDMSSESLSTKCIGSKRASDDELDDGGFVVRQTPVRFTEYDLSKLQNPIINSYIGTDYEICGHGYTAIIMQYNNTGAGSNYWFWIWKYGRYDIENECPYFNLTLVNSDYVAEDYISNCNAYDIKIPLKVENGVLKGKTINNFDKTTYINKYGDTYNSSVTNRWELECYIDEEFVKTMTGADFVYEDVMLACQSARNAYLTGMGKISGFAELDGSEALECRVKDIERVETYSRYNGTNKVPSLKITLEIHTIVNKV